MILKLKRSKNVVFLIGVAFSKHMQITKRMKNFMLKNILLLFFLFFAVKLLFIFYLFLEKNESIKNLKPIIFIQV